LERTNLFGGLPVSYSLLRQLQTLVLSNNALEGSIPSSYGQLASLTKINLNNNKLSGDSCGHRLAGQPGWAADIVSAQKMGPHKCTVATAMPLPAWNVCIAGWWLGLVAVTQPLLFIHCKRAYGAAACHVAELNVVGQLRMHVHDNEKQLPIAVVSEVDEHRGCYLFTAHIKSTGTVASLLNVTSMYCPAWMPTTVDTHQCAMCTMSNTNYCNVCCVRQMTLTMKIVCTIVRPLLALPPGTCLPTGCLEVYHSSGSHSPQTPGALPLSTALPLQASPQLHLTIQNSATPVAQPFWFWLCQKPISHDSVTWTLYCVAKQGTQEGSCSQASMFMAL